MFHSVCGRLLMVILVASFLLVTVGCGTNAEEPAVAADTEETQKTPEATSAPAKTADEDDGDQPADDEAATAPDEDGQAGDEDGEVPEPRDPFVNKAPAPEFPKDMTWINTGGPMRMRDLKGKFVLLDFWTYCCINCIHILPELKKLEKAYPNEIVVIGVHAAKFETEKGTKNIEEAVRRYEIEHPVVNDAEHRIWRSYRVQSWPSLRMIDPEGNWVADHSGEITFEQLDGFMKQVLPYYKKKGTLDETPIHFDLLSARETKKTPLRFPGKVLADEASDRLFIADSNHNRIVISSLNGRLLDTIGTGAIGQDDGDYKTATFDHPQGMALHGDTLYVADTESHTLRKIDLKKKRVETIAGTGEQGSAWPGLEGLGRFDELPDRFVGKPKETALNSPWALWVHEADLYIAMAGPHQIWKMPLDESEIGPYAGNGREDIVDGRLLPPLPFREGSAFAQPSGLTSDGEWLYVADSEGSSIRAVPFDPKKEVRTLVGTSQLPGGRLFAFGDQDGKQPLSKFVVDEDGNPIPDENGDYQYKGVLLQHALGVIFHDGQIYVADTYNNKIKQVNAKTGETNTIAGTGEPGRDDEPATFDEPAGISYAAGKLYVADTNNHLIRTVDLETRKVSTLNIADLQPPAPPVSKRKPTFPGAVQLTTKSVAVRAEGGTIKLRVKLNFAEGWKINQLAPMGYLLEATRDSGPVARDKLADGLTLLEKPATTFDIEVPVSGSGEDKIKVSMEYLYCQFGGEGLCKKGSVVWTVPVQVADDANAGPILLEHNIDPEKSRPGQF